MDNDSTFLAFIFSLVYGVFQNENIDLGKKKKSIYLYHAAYIYDRDLDIYIYTHIGDIIIQICRALFFNLHFFKIQQKKYKEKQSKKERINLPSRHAIRCPIFC